MMRLPHIPNVYRIAGIGLCTIEGGYIHPFDQLKGLTGRNVPPWAHKLTPDHKPHPVRFAGSQRSNYCHHTQRLFMRSMEAVECAFGEDPSKYANWSPPHVPTPAC